MKYLNICCVAMVLCCHGVVLPWCCVAMVLCCHGVDVNTYSLRGCGESGDALFLQFVARMADGSRLHQFKEKFGTNLLAGFSRINGYTFVMHVCACICTCITCQ